MLLFKKRFLPAIRAGEKTQTVRLWPIRRMKAGQRSYIPGAGYIKVLAVDEVTLQELTLEDAQFDGFSTREELLQAVSEVYATESTRDYKAYRVRFRLAPELAKDPSAL